MADISLRDLGSSIENVLTPTASSRNRFSMSDTDFTDIGKEINRMLMGSEEETPQPKLKAKPRGFIAETASALSSGVVQTGEALAGTAEMAVIPGAGTARKYLQDLQGNDMLARPDYLKEGTVLDNPERLSDWRWWTRSLGENLPNMVTMMFPGVAAIKGAQALNWGAKAIRAAGLSGAWTGSMAIEAGSAYSQAKQEMAQNGTFDAPTIERVATMEGLAAGTVNSIIELLPFDNLFLRQAGADRLVKRIVRQAFLEGSTETAQEAVNVLVEKMGHKPDQKLSDNIGRMLEAGIIGGTMGGMAGGTVGTRVHSRNVKRYNDLADSLGIREDVTQWKKDGLSDEAIAGKVSETLKKNREMSENINADLPEDKQMPVLSPDIDAKEMTSYLLYGKGAGIITEFSPEPGIIGKQVESARDKVYRAMGMKVKSTV
ncbi:MAG TPA: hypothetical protein DCG53_02425, partial [Syntrophus sp. (in: bacteria)]|nr:hypothetical protein [Syntrophus sp. (in: bacteria)]